MKLRQRFIYTFLLLLSAVLAACVSAQAGGSHSTTNTTPKPEKVTIGVGAQHAIVYLDFDVAAALGYFEEEGLDVELQYFAGGSDAANALIGGSVDFSGNAIDHALKAQVQGENLRMVHNILTYPCVTLIANSERAAEIGTLSDLAGHTIGVTRFGSATHVLLVQMLADVNLSPGDVDIVEVGTSTMPAALEANAIDAAVGAAPYTSQLIAAGRAVPMVDLCDPVQATEYIGGGLPFTGMLTRDAVLAARPEVAQKVENAMVKAHDFITSHSAAEIVAILPQSIVGDDVEIYTLALAEHLSAFNQHSGQIDPSQFDTLVHLHETFGTFPAGTTIDVDALYTNELVETAVELLDDNQ